MIELMRRLGAPGVGGAPVRSRRCIVFLHIPKTGGTTLRATLRYKYPSQTVTVHDLSDPKEAMDRIPDDDLRAARAVTGHLLYGVHHHIPQDCDYVAVLREPVARTVSAYNYILGHPAHWFHDELVRSGMGLEEFAGSGSGPPDNMQTRVIAGSRDGELVRRGPDRHLERTELGIDMLEAAKRHLDRFLVVGLTESFDESFILVRRALGWKLPMYASRRITQRRRSEPPSTEAVELIRERNQLDIELYAYARELFSLAVERQGSSFRREVAAFKVLNRVPNTIGPQIPAQWRHPLRALAGRGSG